MGLSPAASDLEGRKRDALAIHPETAKRIRTTAMENAAKLEGIQWTVGNAGPSTMQLYDRRRFTPEKSASLIVSYGDVEETPL